MSCAGPPFCGPRYMDFLYREMKIWKGRSNADESSQNFLNGDLKIKALNEVRLFKCSKIKLELWKLPKRPWGFIDTVFFNRAVLKLIRCCVAQRQLQFCWEVDLNRAAGSLESREPQFSCHLLSGLCLSVLIWCIDRTLKTEKQLILMLVETSKWSQWW